MPACSLLDALLTQEFYGAGTYVCKPVIAGHAAQQGMGQALEMILGQMHACC